MQVDDTLSKIGVGFAKDMASIQTGFDLFQRRLRISGLFDYRSGGNTLEGNYFQCSSAPKACRDSQDPTAPLWMQARAVAITNGTKVERNDVHHAAWLFLAVTVLEVPRAVGVVRPAESHQPLRASHERFDHRVRPPEHPHVDELHRRGSRTELWRERQTRSRNDFNTSPPPTYITFRLNLKY